MRWFFLQGLLLIAFQMPSFASTWVIYSSETHDNPKRDVLDQIDVKSITQVGDKTYANRRTVSKPWNNNYPSKVYSEYSYAVNCSKAYIETLDIDRRPGGDPFVVLRVNGDEWWGMDQLKKGIRRPWSERPRLKHLNLSWEKEDRKNSSIYKIVCGA